MTPLSEKQKSLLKFARNAAERVITITSKQPLKVQCTSVLKSFALVQVCCSIQLNVDDQGITVSARKGQQLPEVNEFLRGTEKENARSGLRDDGSTVFSLCPTVSQVNE